MCLDLSLWFSKITAASVLKALITKFSLSMWVQIRVSPPHTWSRMLLLLSGSSRLPQKNESMLWSKIGTPYALELSVHSAAFPIPLQGTSEILWMILILGSLRYLLVCAVLDQLLCTSFLSFKDGKGCELNTKWTLEMVKEVPCLKIPVGKAPKDEVNECYLWLRDQEARHSWFSLLSRNYKRLLLFVFTIVLSVLHIESGTGVDISEHVFQVKFLLTC